MQPTHVFTGTLHLSCSPPTDCGGPKVSKEQGKRILREASRKRSEPFPEEIAEALQNLKLEHQIQHANTSDTEASIAEQPPHPISEPAPTPASTPSSTHTFDSILASTATTPTSTLPTQKKGKPKRRRSITRPTSLINPRNHTKPPKPQPSPSDPSALFNKSVRHLRAASAINLNLSLTTSTSTLQPSDPTTTMSRPVSLLIASLGNPPPYHSTRHSAAHLVLKSLQQSLSLPPFTPKHKSYGGGHISSGFDASRPEFTLYQSAVQMNVSGPPLLKAWKQFSQLSDGAGRVAGLVVLHDEMEIQPGALKVRRGNGSAKGHNGIKSVQGSLQGAGILDGLGNRLVKVGIGIGRPGGGTRESKDVSAYVLGQLTGREKEGLEGTAREVEGCLYAEMGRIAMGG
ncbi:hypothetical protein PMZ80_005611 [Knufia obscura]|uniref:peptidyl-tRNA hydrolase n=1 Tax=Knufia obscura TaxID=1635080 RepID=A0ABR0RMP4_9EURO|nr:hypothetical protein PMZ80_005611 [Knufia obscura]